MRSLLLPLAGVALLAACSGAEQPDSDSATEFANRAGVASASPAAAPAAEINAQPIMAPTGAARLAPLAKDAPRALGQFTGGCTFAYQARTVLVVRPPVAAGGAVEGLLVVDGQQIILPGAAAQDPAAGLTLAGAGYTVTITPGAEASLLIDGPQGRTNFTPGTWSCAA